MVKQLLKRDNDFDFSHYAGIFSRSALPLFSKS